MSVLGRAQILARKPKLLTVTLPDSDESVIIRRMSALDWERIRERDPKDQNLGMQLAMIICDEQGRRQFDPDNLEDCKELADQLSIAEAGVILTAAGKLSTPESKEDITKKSEAVQSSDLVTASA